MNSVGVPIENPVLVTLKRHVRLEEEIYAKQNNTLYLAWIVIASSYLNDVRRSTVLRLATLLESKAERLASYYGRKQVDTTELSALGITGNMLREFALGIRAITAANGKAKSKVEKATVVLLEYAIEREWFSSPSVAGVTAFALGNMSPFERYAEDAKGWLLAKLPDYVRSDSLHLVADSLLGLGATEVPTELSHNRLLEDAQHQSPERIAKLLIWYALREDKERQKNLSFILEQRVREKFEDWSIPSLELGLLEGINLLSTNLPSNEVKELLERLREDGVEWASILDIDEGRLILTDLPDIARVPRLDAAEDALTVIALILAGRARIYQLDEDELPEVEEALRQRTHDLTANRRDARLAYCLSWFLISAIGGIALLFITSQPYILASRDVLLKGLASIQWNVSILTVQALFGLLRSVNPPTRVMMLTLLLYILLLVWYLRLADRLYRLGGFDGVRGAVELFPVLHSLLGFWDRHILSRRKR